MIKIIFQIIIYTCHSPKKGSKQSHEQNIIPTIPYLTSAPKFCFPNKIPNSNFHIVANFNNFQTTKLLACEKNDGT